MNVFLTIMENWQLLNISQYFFGNKYIPPLVIFFGGYHYLTKKKKYENDYEIKIRSLKEEHQNIINQRENEIYHMKVENDSLKELNINISLSNDKLLKQVYELTDIIKNRDETISEKNELIKSSNEKLEEIYQTKLKENKKTYRKIEYCGDGELRYKSKCGNIYYHGIGHLERKYMWWDLKFNRNIIHYKNNKKEIKYPNFETYDIDTFCNNCEYSEENNKNQRNKFYYVCKGHKINVD